MCDKWEYVDRSLSNEDTKFQYCTIKHLVASKWFRMRSFCQPSWKHIVGRRQRSSFSLKMNWWLQKRSKYRQKCMVMNVLPRTNIFKWYGKFHNGGESADDNPREKHLRTGRTLEHIPKICAALADDRCSRISSTFQLWSSWTANSDKKYMELRGAASNINKPCVTSRKTAFPKYK